VRGMFPERAWPRVFALLSGAWSVAVLIGPLVGGLFARYADWRGAFVTIAAIAALLVVVAFLALPRTRVEPREAVPRAPFGRVALIALAIAMLSLAAIAEAPLAKGTP